MTATAIERQVEAETLDHLAHDDPTAQRSRRDLQRVHRAMRTRAIVSPVLRDALGATHAPSVLELGAGDGTLLLGVARAGAPWPHGVELTLLDRHPLLSAASIAEYAQVGWTARAQVADVSEWVRDEAAAAAQRRWTLIVATLFLHHFEDAALRELLGAVAERCDRFFACEPRRGYLALAGSHLVGALGANAVTRNDAVLSVRAGFSGHELSALWPESQRSQWRLDESAAPPFSHCLSAERIGFA
jgi:hypothetical protein